MVNLPAILARARFQDHVVGWCEHFVNVDFDERGEIVGIEIVAPDDASVDLVSTFAHANELSLTGVFVPLDA